MRQKNILFAIGLLIGVADLLSAQLNLNRTPSRALGWPKLAVSNFNPNLVEGREFDQPQGVAIDNSVTPPVLYVSDLANNRVLGWKNAVSFSFGAMADFVIGQPDFFSTTALGPGTGVSTGLRNPAGLAVDKSGNLYVIDTGNNRILRFPTPYNQPGQPLPDLVIGQTDLSCSTCNRPNSGGISASTIALAGSVILPASIVFDSQGNLWLTDAGNNRVLRYPVSALGANASNGPAADLVLGQVDFVTSTPPAQTSNPTNDLQSKTGMANPSSLAFDPTGRLYVTEFTGNSRVLVFPPNLQPPFSNGASASRLMGVIVPSRTTPAPPPINNTQFANPQGIFMVGNKPCVVDSGNNRILLFDPFEQWPTDQSSPQATNAGPIGQVGFASGKANRGGQAEPGPQTLSTPSVAVATATELFVVDSGNNRLLVFSLTNLGQNSSATRVLGQDDFAFGSPNLIEGREVNFTGSGGDGGLIVDLVSTVPHLYIADTYNNRVLGYLDARKVRPGDKADLVIGQPDFQRSVINYPTNNATRPSAQSLFGPVGLALDVNGNLYVADTGNGRVLRFPAPFNQPQPNNYPSADLVIGQSSLTTQIKDATQRTMHAPYGLAFTSDGGLLVSDSFLSRVLFFPGPSSGFTSGMAASKVFGQTDYSSFTPGTDTNQMNGPRHIATDPDDRLYVADAGNNRIMIYDQVPFAGANARAGTVLTGPTPFNNFSSPLGLFVNKTTGEIWVSEAGVARITRFPRFDNLLGNQNQSDLQIPSPSGVAVAQDAFDNLFVADIANRIAIYFPGLTAVNAANNIPGRALAPSTVAIAQSQGYHFSSDGGQADSSGWPTVLADTQVLVNNTPAAIQNVMLDQLTFLMPSGAPTSGSVEVQVVHPSTGQTVAVGQVDMAPVSPGLFTLNGMGTGQVMAINDDGTPNLPSSQISRGHVISLFGTGLGIVPSAPPDGQPPSDPVPADTTPDVWIGAAFVDPANIMFSGLAPGMIGVWRIDVKVPDLTAPALQVPVFIRMKSIASEVAGQVTTISVKQ
jgi:uncharacterized protein (TIGR03437 family)